MVDDQALPAFQHLKAQYVELAGAIARAADREAGPWWQVVTKPGRERNYLESSSTALFTYSLVKGVRLGFVDEGEKPERFVEVGKKAYDYMTENFVVKEANGTLGWNNTVTVCSLNSTATYEYYVGQPILYNSLIGSSAFVLASLEMERAGERQGW